MSSDFMVAATISSDLEPKKRKHVTTSTFSPFICHEVMGPDAMTLVFVCLFSIFSFKLALSLSSFTLIKRFFSFSLLSTIIVVIICISEVVDVSPAYLDSSLCFIQPGILHDVLSI